MVEFIKVKIKQSIIWNNERRFHFFGRGNYRLFRSLWNVMMVAHLFKRRRALFLRCHVALCGVALFPCWFVHLHADSCHRFANSQSTTLSHALFLRVSRIVHSSCGLVHLFRRFAPPLCWVMDSYAESCALHAESFTFMQIRVNVLLIHRALRRFAPFPCWLVTFYTGSKLHTVKYF